MTRNENSNPANLAGLTIFIVAFGLISCFAPICPIYARSLDSLGSPRGYVNDYEDVLSGQDFKNLQTLCKQLQDANKAEMAIVIIDSTDGREIEDYAQSLFTKWGIGKRGADNGLLILIALNDRAWRVHTGYAVESAIPDSLAKRVMERELVPEFREVNYGAGLINAVSTFKSILEGEKYEVSSDFDFGNIIILPIIATLLGLLIWLGVRIKCPRCGSRVKLDADRAILDATYSNAGIRKKEYTCSVCHHEFARMTVIPMLVERTSGSSSSGWGGGWSSGGSSSSGGGGGFGGGSSGGGGASGGW